MPLMPPIRARNLMAGLRQVLNAMAKSDDAEARRYLAELGRALLDRLEGAA